MASVTGLNTSGLNFSGLATGINTDTIIEGLTKINQQRLDTLKARQDDYASKQATFTALQGKLFDLQSKAANLARSAGGAFDGRKASSSDEDAMTAAAGTAAVPGTYTITIDALAQAHQVASAGFSDPNARIKEGTVSLRVGSGTATTVTVDSRNNTLQGFADSINAAGGDVRASGINDGSANPYRLMLTSSKTGAANAITVTNNLTGGTGAAIDPTATTVQAAGDAVVKLGSGAISVSSATNQVNSLIPGVSMNLHRAEVGKPIALSVTNDTTAATKAMQDFVDAYNGVVSFVADRTGFDKDTQAAGSLLGNRDVAQLGDDIAAALTTSIPGLSAAVNRLSSVGLSFDNGGKLVLDSSKFSQAVAGQNSSTLADVKKLFSLSGSSANPGVSFTFGGDKTKPSGTTPYAAHVTAPATRAVVTSSGPPATSVVINPPNSTLQMKINSLAGEITIPSGTYTPEELAAIVQKQINAAPAFNNNLVSVGLDGDGKLQISSQQYGSGSKVEVTGGTAMADLGFAAPASATGTNVAGYFMVDGKVEAATGSGQSLTGNAGNANTDGLQVRSSLSAAGTADVTVTQGLASKLNAVLSKYLDPTNGRFKTISDDFTDSIKELDKSITKQNDMMAEKKEQLMLRFAAMESAVNNLKGLQSQLTSLIPTMTTR